MSKAKESGITHYSDMVVGERRNYNRAARFDYTDGFVGISEFNEIDGPVRQRVLLSTDQVVKLLEFLKEQRQRTHEG